MSPSPHQQTYLAISSAHSSPKSSASNATNPKELRRDFNCHRQGCSAFSYSWHSYCSSSRSTPATLYGDCSFVPGFGFSLLRLVLVHFAQFPSCARVRRFIRRRVSHLMSTGSCWKTSLRYPHGSMALQALEYVVKACVTPSFSTTGYRSDEEDFRELDRKWTINVSCNCTSYWH